MQPTLSLFTAALVVLFSFVAIGTHLLRHAHSAKMAASHPRLSRVIAGVMLLSVMGWLSLLPMASALEAHAQAERLIAITALLSAVANGIAFGVCTSLLDGMTNAQGARA